MTSTESTNSYHSAPASITADPDRFTAGQPIGERFRILTPLGKGGMGEVFQAEDLLLGQSVALKFLPQRLTLAPDRLQRLRSEVKTARQVAHPNVCRVYDLDEAAGQFFLTMEFIDGQNLASVLKQSGALTEERGVEIFRQLCLGLGAIHDQRVLHRDLKPSNVMLDSRGQVKITDFGLAAYAELLQPHELFDGTPAYQSPEQRAGRAVTARSDLFALGLIMYEVFAGSRPPTGDAQVALPDANSAQPADSSPRRLSTVSPAVEQIILKCLSREPAERPASAYEVLAALPEATMEGSLNPRLEIARETVKRHRLEESRQDQYWSAYLESYDRLLMEFPPFMRLIDDLIAVVPPGRQAVVDLGAGTGCATAALLAAGHAVTAVESSAAMIDRLRYLAKKMRGMSLRIVPSKVDDLRALADSEFDAAVMLNVLYAVTDPLACLRGVHRILKPRGVLAFSTTHAEISLDALLTSLKDWLEATGQYEVRSNDYQLIWDLNKRIETTIAKRHTRDEYRAWTRAAGFEIIHDVPSTYEGAVMMIHARKI
ncbi:MAG TPA: protein kinase [Pirellulaceae bacterium]|nr:protein kinase [Pirellulaceae bacterium]